MEARLILLIVGGLSMTTACGGDDDDGTPVLDCEKAPPRYTDVSAFDQCQKCHSSELGAGERMSAPAKVNFDTYEGARSVAKAAVGAVKTGSMPPANSGIEITEAQRQTLYDWVTCGTQE